MTEPSRRAPGVSRDLEAVLEESSLHVRVFSEIRQRCAGGRPLDAKAFLEENPKLEGRKSIVLDLAYEEYCQRTEAGESVDPDTYCRQFPTYARSLRRLLAVHEFLDEHSDLIPPVDVDWPKPTETFQGFTLLAQLGRGSFARVFLAKEIALGNRLVAVKLSVDGAGEAKILGKLAHPNIVPVYSVRQDAKTGLTVVCMPYLGRVTLFDVLERLSIREAKPTRAQSILEALQASAGEVSPGDAEAPPVDPRLRRGSFVDGVVHLGAQLADALDHAHAQGICHCDLKPSNVLISPEGTPMLLDFNLAFDPQAIERRLGGTLPYMSPEQLRALVGPEREGQLAVGPRSDIFSLGVMLYELLSGRLPFGQIPTKGSLEQVKTDLLSRQESGPLALRAVNRQVDLSLADLVESCLAFDLQDRPQSAEALARALRRHISPARRARRWVGQHRRTALATMAGGLLVGFSVVYHLATQDPYPVRQYREGLSHYDRQDYAQANVCFTTAIRSTADGRTSAKAYFWRGRARLKLDRFSAAAKDFELAHKFLPGGESLACQGYAWGLAGLSPECVRYSEQAVKAGYAAPEIYNNLGYAYLQLGHFGPAIDALSRAAELDEPLQAALHNRAWAEFRDSARNREPLNPAAGQDIDRAIAAGPGTAYLYYDAALIHDRLGQESGQHDERKIVGYLREALRRGADPSMVREKFPDWVEDPGLQRAFESEVAVVQRDLANHLTDPVRDGAVSLR